MVKDPEETLKELLSTCFEGSTLLQASLSSPRSKKGEFLRVAIRPLLIRGEDLFQITRSTQEKTFHENITQQICKNLLLSFILHEYKQCILKTKIADYHILSGKEGRIKILKKPPTTSLKMHTHNRPKKYLLQEGIPIPFLVELGIMNNLGKILSNKRDKFKQIHRFLEIVSTVLPSISEKEKLHVLDFGCGKAYLTFALYHYLNHHLNLAVDIVGVDLKEDVVQNCQRLAEELEFEGLHFFVGDINTYQPQEEIDLMVSLHACDTATDAALEKAVEWKAKAILSAPCCQHELFAQISNQKLKPLLQHGILKEKFSALATDAARGKLLEILGYQVDIMEFIDPEHTPKNILIRAKLKSKIQNAPKLLEEYLAFKELLQITPSLEKRLSKWLKPWT